MTRKRNETESMGAAAAPARRRVEARRTKPATPVAAVAAVAPVAPSAAPTHDEIAALAYSYWVARGYQGGTPEEDWLRAEQELVHHYA